MERKAAATALAKARESVERVTDADLRSNLIEALRAAEAELDDRRSRSLAAEMQEAVLKQEDNRASRLAAAVIAAAVDAALREPPTT